LKAKNRLVSILATVIVLAGLIFVIVLVILLDIIASLKSKESKNNLKCSTQLKSQRDEIDKLNSSNYTLLNVYNNRFLSIDIGFSNFSVSCAEILAENNASVSGYYFLKSRSGQVKNVYCDMTKYCGGIPGGWMRVAKLDVQNCPSELQQNIYNTSSTNVTACIVRNKVSDCTSLFYSSQDIPYSRVCGKITAYQVGILDDFHDVQVGINDNYLDGVSVTVNRSHVWSLAAGRRCWRRPPRYVGNSYYCERAGVRCEDNSVCDCPSDDTLCEDLLWNTTWHKQLSRSVVTDLEVRICCYRVYGQEDIALTALELYVQ